MKTITDVTQVHGISHDEIFLSSQKHVWSVFLFPSNHQRRTLSHHFLFLVSGGIFVCFTTFRARLYTHKIMCIFDERMNRRIMKVCSKNLLLKTLNAIFLSESSSFLIAPWTSLLAWITKQCWDNSAHYQLLLSEWLLWSTIDGIQNYMQGKIHLNCLVPGFRLKNNYE